MHHVWCIYPIRANKRDFRRIMRLGFNVCVAFNHCLEYPLKCFIRHFISVCGMRLILVRWHDKKLLKNQKQVLTFDLLCGSIRPCKGQQNTPQSASAEEVRHDSKTVFGVSCKCRNGPLAGFKTWLRYQLKSLLNQAGRGVKNC